MTMEIRIHPTSKLVELQGPDGGLVPARLWEGETVGSGIGVHCYVTRIAVKSDENLKQFEEELIEVAEPTEAIQAIPARLVL